MLIRVPCHGRGLARRANRKPCHLSQVQTPPQPSQVSRACAAANIIPTSTGAARALSLVIPELKDKFDGFSLRVPTITVSVVDFSATLTRPATRDAVNDAFKAAKAGPMKGILGYTDEPLDSLDFRGDDRFSIIDGQSTMFIGDKFLKVVSWYDYEWGYSSRVADLTKFIAEKL
jgi:glyceraldehyde 3-phosphate dehydrogenase (phosphorylating)